MTQQEQEREPLLEGESLEAFELAVETNKMSTDTHTRFDYYVPEGMGLCMDSEYSCAEKPHKFFSYASSSNFLTTSTVAVTAFIMQATWIIASFIGTVLGRLFSFKPVKMEVGFTPDGPRIMYMLNADKLAAKGLPEDK